MAGYYQKFRFFREMLQEERAAGEWSEAHQRLLEQAERVIESEQVLKDLGRC